MSPKLINITDALYTDVSFDDHLSSLISRPVIQRLRHVRLSNVDSVAMPGIANISRYEHVLGVSYLVRHLSFAAGLSGEDKIALEAAGMLHDWAISPYGHLVEEAFSYAGKRFDHEHKLLDLIESESAEEAGGIGRQLFMGRETGLEQWAQEVFGPAQARPRLREITDWIRGRGRFGQLISSGMDLDNIDNVTRIGFHMGIPMDRELPVRIVSSILRTEPETNVPVFQRTAFESIIKWLELRASVYEKLMPAEPDFGIKTMVLYAAVSAIENGEIQIRDWNLTDREFVNRLLDSDSPECRDTAVRWQAGEFWDTSPLCWVRGERPSYPALRSFSKELSEELGRICFVYGIKDKRKRQLSIQMSDGPVSLGSKSDEWLAGVGSPVRRAFTAKDQRVIATLLQHRFDCEVKSTAIGSDTEQLCLL